MEKYNYISINGEFYDKKFLDEVWKELKAKVAIWEMGLDTPSKCDKFAYNVLMQITMDKRNV